MCERLERLLREAATEWRFYPVIQALQTMRGAQFTVAVGLLAEIGEFSRFDAPRQLMAWLGLVPSEYSSGLRKRQGAITRCGNSFARRLLIEAAWAYRYPPKVSPSIRKRHDVISRLIVDAPGTRSCVCANAFASLPGAASRTTWRWWRLPATFPASSGTSQG